MGVPNKMSPNEISPPGDIAGIASWFLEAVKVEIEAVTKESARKSYELLSGQLLDSSQGMFEFILAEGQAILEEASGRLMIEQDEFLANVVSQMADRLTIQIQGMRELPTNIPRAILVVDDVALLKKLEQVLEGISTNPGGIGSLPVQVFHPTMSEQAEVDIEYDHSTEPRSEQWTAIRRACGSSVSFIWGPPGTGKTFVIANLIAALVAKGERVLVTSHTHAAVDQAAYEATKDTKESLGPLTHSALISDGKVLRVGTVPPQSRIPDCVRLDSVVKERAKDITARVAEIEGILDPLSREQQECEANLSEWKRLEALAEEGKRKKDALQLLETQIPAAESATQDCRGAIADSERKIHEAQQAWFFRKSRLGKALKDLSSANPHFPDGH